MGNTQNKGVITLINVLNPSLQPLAIIDTYTNDAIQETINGIFTLAFTAVIDEDGKSEYLVDGNLAEVEGQLFNVVHHRRTRSTDGSILIAVDCEHVSYNLLLYEWAAGFVHAGTPEQLLEMVLAGTGFTIGTVQLGAIISVDLAENISARAILMEIAVQSGGELLFNGYEISLLTRRGQLRGVQFILGKNILGIIKDVDTRSGEVVTGYEIDVLELNSLPEFEGLEYFELGDTVPIIDPELGIDEDQRIVGYTYSPRRRINSKVVISNKILGIADAVVALRKTTVVKDKFYYGTRVGPEIGFETIRSDNKGRSIYNADKIALQKGDGSGSSWTDVISLDSEGNGLFTGTVTASSFVGGSITIGTAFSVNEAGHMVAVGGEFSGEITAAIITGGTINGTSINGSTITGSLIQTAASGVYPRAEMSVTENLFAASQDANNHVKIQTDLSGAPGIRFTADNVVIGSLNSYQGFLEIWVPSILRLTAPRVRFGSWGAIYNDSDGKTLSEVLDEIYNLLDSKADSYHSHSVTLPNHNHGNPDNLNSGGGTYSVS